MSSRKLSLEFSPASYEDRIAIIHYTAATWGEAQARTSHAMLDEALETICLHPAIGTTSPDLPESYHLYPIGPHVIIYRIRQEVISIVRILHQRMSMTIHV